MKGDRLIKDRQHVQLIYDGMEFISKARGERKKDHINIYTATLISIGYLLLMIINDKTNATLM